MLKRWTFAPVSSRIARKILGGQELKDLAHRKEIVCDSEQRNYFGSTISLRNQLERITGVHEFSSTIEAEIDICTRQHADHRQTVAYQLKDIFLINGILCNYRDFEYLSFKRPPFKPSIVKHEFSLGALSSSNAGNDFFAHFVFDDATTAALAPDFGPVIFANLGVSRTEQMLAYLQAFHVSEFKDVETAHFDEIWVFDDIGLNSHKVNRLQKHRDMLKPHNVNFDRPGSYIMRGETGTKRELSNELEIINELEKIGFNIIEPEKLSLNEIIKQLNGSPIVIGIEGSQLIHAVMNQMKGGTLLCIQPPTRFNAVFRSLTSAVGLDWGYVVGISKGNSFYLPIADLLKTIDLVYK